MAESGQDSAQRVCDSEADTAVAHGYRKNRGTGLAVCDIKGALWELDPLFLVLMKELSPGWRGGDLPANMLESLKNTGQYQVAGWLLTAAPTAAGKIQLRLRHD